MIRREAAGTKKVLSGHRPNALELLRRVEKEEYSHAVTEHSRKKRSLEAESRHVDHTWIDFLSCVKCQIDCDVTELKLQKPPKCFYK